MIINHNISALNIYNNINRSNELSSKAANKISSGLRINSAADDSAGLAISQGMKAQIRGLEQAQRNIQDGISLIQTAEGGLSQVENPNLQRMRELTIQAANGNLTSEDKAIIQKEIDEIKNSINDIANNTEFNGIKLLNGSNPYESGINGGTIPSNYNYENVLVFDNCVDADGEFQFRTSEGYPTTEADDNQILIFGSGITSKPKVKIDGTVYSLKSTTVTPTVLDGDTYKTVYTIEDKNVEVTQLVKIVKDKYEIRYCAKNNDSLDHNIGVQFHVDTKLGNDDGAPFIVNNNPVSNETIYTSDIPDSFIVYNQSTGSGANAEFQGSGILKSTGDFSIIEEPSKFAIGQYSNVSNWDFTPTTSVGDSGYSIWWNPRNVSTGSSFEVNTFYGMSVPPTIEDPTQVAIDEGPYDIKLQVGPNSGDVFKVQLSDVRTTKLGVDDVIIDPFEEAEKSISKIDRAIEMTSLQRAKFGAYQNAVEHIYNNVSNGSINLSSALSRIEDADIAKEVMEMSKSNIIQQSAQSLIAQANKMPESILNLMKQWGQT